MEGLSDINEMMDKVSRYDDFDFSGTLGSFVNNYEFLQGLNSYQSGNCSNKAYIWHVLSAIGQQVGQVLHSNVKYYIDNVSNIDTCKIQALESMVKQLGFDYQLFEKTDTFPIEVQNLINIFSIDRNYIIRNSFLNDDLRASLSSDGVIFSENTDMISSSLYQIDVFSQNISNNLQGKFSDVNINTIILSDYISCDSFLAGDRLFSNAYGTNIVQANGCYILAKDKQIQTAFQVSSISHINYSEHKLSVLDIPTSVAEHLYIDPCHLSSFGDSSIFIKRTNTLSSDNVRIDDVQYSNYVKQIYYDLLSSVLDMRYTDISGTLVRTTLGDDSYFFKSGYFNQMNDEFNTLNASDSTIKQLKLQYAVTGFDEISIVDAIEHGKDSLDNYQGIKLIILQKEIDNRKSSIAFPSTIKDLSAAGTQTYEQATRYSFYRKQKVLEYAKFIDNKYFSDLCGVSIIQYKFDTDYTEQSLASDKRHVINNKNKDYSINSDIVDYVARALTDTTFYIEKLRQKLKLQSRKNFMKGTQNLIKFIISEYMRDYANFNMLERGLSASEILSAIAQTDSNNIDIQEYIDLTEYYNLSTETSKYAASYETDTLNVKFFEQFIKTSDTGILTLKKPTEYFGFDGIVGFYLDGMKLQDTDENRQYVLRLLSATFDAGAVRTYVGSDSITHGKMLDGRYTKDMLKELNVLSSGYKDFLSILYMSSDISTFSFVYPSTVWEQEDQARQHILSASTDIYMSSVYDTYNKYYSPVISVASQVSSVQEDVDKLISSDYPYYFYKQDECKFCYDSNSIYTDDQYRHDYFVGKSQYQYTDIDQQIAQLNVFVSDSGNIVNHVVLDTADALLNGYSGYAGYYGLQSQLKINIISKITSYGYDEISSELLETEADSIEQFLTTLKADRISYLKGVAEQLNNQAKELKLAYEDLESQFNSTLKSAPDFSDGYMEDLGCSVITSQDSQHFIKYDDYSAAYIVGCSKTSEKAAALNFAPPVGRQRVDRISGMKMLDTDLGTDASTKSFAFGYLTFCQQFLYHSVSKSQLIADTDTFSEKLEKMLKLMDPDNKVFYGESAATCAGCYSAFVSIKANLIKLKLTWDAIVGALSSVFSITYNETRLTTLLDIEYIVDLQAYLVTSLTDTVYASDAKVKEYQSYIDKLSQWRKSYNLHEDALNDLTAQDAYTSYVQGLDSAEFTPTFLGQLSAYAISADAINKVTIIDRIQEDNQKLTDLIEQLKLIVSDLKIYIENDVYEKYVVDEDSKIVDLIENILASLDEDVNNRTTDARVKIQAVIDHLDNDIYAGAFNKYVFDSADQKWDSDQYKMCEEIESEISSVNFFQFDEYSLMKGLNSEYSAVSSSDHPYYNHKNVTHPSFQPHQFLLNFQPQTLFRETDFTKSYINVFDQTFGFDNIDKCIDQYIGEFGQSIDLWKTNSIDYTGYVTAYEKSSHLNDNNVSSEVIDYEGAFYPPAAEEFRNATFRDRIGNTVSSAATRRGIALSAALSVDTAEKYSKSNLLSVVYGSSARYYDYSISQCEAIVDSFISANYSVDSDTFYDSVAPSALSCHLLSSFRQTFYEKYYSHLALTEADLAHIAMQLSVYGDRIVEIASEHRLSDVYDIYKYGKDKYYNNYILYKRYAQSSPSFQQKRDTRGELWLRLSDHPIAFPAISPAPGTVSCFSYTAIELSSSKYGAEYVNNYMFEKTNNIELSGKCFYDFDFSTDKDILLLVHDPYDPDGTVYPSSRAKEYSKANVSMTYVSRLEDSLTNRTIYGFNGQAESTNDSVVKGTHNTDLYTNVSKDLRTSPTRFKLVGTFAGLADTVKIIAVSFPKDGVCMMSDSTLRVYTASKSNMNFVERTARLSQPGCDNDMIAIGGYEVDNAAYLDVALYQSTSDHYTDYSAYAGASVNIGQNSEGESPENIYASEINSHDVFFGNVIVKTYRLSESSAIESQTKTFNTVADIAYIPSFPGLSGELSLGQELANTEKDYFSIELLGRSNNIDKAVLGVNISADPYLTDDDMYGDSINANGEVRRSNVALHGRVFEDYSASADNSLRVYKNAYISRKAGSAEKMSIVLDLSAEPFRYTDDDLWSMNLLVYNTGCSGKNPYFAGQLRNLNKIGKNYNPADATYGNDIKVAATGYTSNFDCAVAGTFTLDSQFNYDSNNHLRNVKSIDITYDKSAKRLTMDLYVDDAEIESSIASDTIRFCFYNQFMLNQFKHYHLLDTYGIVKTQLAPGDLFADNWSVHYTDESRYNCSYYIDPNTGAKMFLRDVNLDSYDYLSDVYIISPNLSSKHLELAFKAGEELAVSTVLDAQYYPTLNTCYPYNTGFYFADDMRDLSSKSVFAQDNAYVLNLTDAEAVLSNIGRIDIPVMLDDTNDVRVFEDYNLSVTDIPGHEESGSLPNYDRYCSESLKFNQYVHYSEIGSNHWYGNNLTVDMDDPVAVSQLSACKSETYENSAKTEFITIDDIDEQGIDLQHLLKVYASYKYESGKIFLYFNYMNLLNSPFEKYDTAQRPVADIIDGTYLKLAPGENGYLNIVLQFKYYIHHVLYGYVNGTVLTYRIYNVSDDKPKFVIRRVYQPSQYERQNAGIFQHSASRLIKVNLPEKTIAISAGSIGNEISYNVSIEATEQLSNTFEFDLEYPWYLLSCSNFKDIDPTAEYDTPGTLHMAFDPGEYRKEVKFKIHKADMAAIEPYLETPYGITVDAMTYANDDISFEAPSGSITFKRA